MNNNKTNKERQTKNNHKNASTKNAKASYSKTIKMPNVNNRKISRNQQEADILQSENKASIKDDIILILTILVSVLLVLSYFNLCGPLGVGINYVIFGLIGIVGYIFPVILFLLIAYHISNRKNQKAIRRIFLYILLTWFVCALVQIIAGGYNEDIRIVDHFTNSLLSYEGNLRTYGGFLGGMLSSVLCMLAGEIAATVIVVAVIIILFILLTGKALLSYISGTSKNRTKTEDEFDEEEFEDDDEFSSQNIFSRRRKRQEERNEDNLDPYADISNTHNRRRFGLKGLNEEDDELDYLMDDNNSNNEDDNKVSFIEQLKKKGAQSNKEIAKTVVTDNELTPVDETETVVQSDEIYSINDLRNAKLEAQKNQKLTITGTYQKESESTIEEELNKKFGKKEELSENNESDVLKKNPITTNYSTSKVNKQTENSDDVIEFDNSNSKLPDNLDILSSEIFVRSDDSTNSTIIDSSSLQKNESTVFDNKEEAIVSDKKNSTKDNQLSDIEKKQIESEMSKASTLVETTQAYKLPPINLLKSANITKKGVSERELKETAAKLKDTLDSFGVGVTITNISCGPTVTRYEVQPDHGVKVAKITALVDDIKLNLEATDIRIEAPIPGKSAVGIEVPNTENVPVLLRDLIESEEFEKSTSNLTIAVGRDVNGNTIISNIGQMPHLLVAGATGSGKSVCINTIILSLLYKASPKDLKLILIDPKVVELNNYNGIPHLLVPVVTDPKKASAALGWAVNEMDNRYNLFAPMGVRDLKQYNYRIEEMQYQGDETAPEKLPEIVIIVDELSDLMMTTNSKEVEDLIVRLTQKARAAGIHVILATQRPTVSVITGLIKANVPSRIAFSVSSATDSRIILDSMGAERLLGKGDMLFLPSGLPKAIRLQGAFVSDKEVNDVVAFVKSQVSNEANESLKSEQTKNEKSFFETSVKKEEKNDRDDYFNEVGRFIIEKEKASIGMLQRYFSIGFNRAARIMDQLADAKVVGPEEGTKPRKILMTLEEFETYLRQNGLN